MSRRWSAQRVTTRDALCMRWRWFTASYTRSRGSLIPQARVAVYKWKVKFSVHLRAAALVVAGSSALAAASASDSAAAPTAATEVSPAAGQAASSFAGVATTARSSMQAMTMWMARGVDSWFGDQPFENGGKVSDGRLSLSLLKRQGERADIDVRFNASFRLPNVERSTYLFFGRDDPNEVLNDRPGGLSRQERLQTQASADRQFFAGIGRSLTDDIDFRLGMRSGLKLYVQGRYRKQWELGDAGLAEFRQTVFYSVADRAGSTTTFSYDHLFSPLMTVRWLSSATITQRSERFEWSSLVGAYRTFGDQRLLSLEGLVNGLQGSGVPATDWGVQARWEQPIYRNWLIGGVVIGHFWPRPDAQTERRSAWALGVNLKMHF